MGAAEDDEPDAYRESAPSQTQQTVLLFIEPTVGASLEESPIPAAIPRNLTSASARPWSNTTGSQRSSASSFVACC